MTPALTLEEEILKVYNAYWDGYMSGDMNAFASFLSEDVKVIGSTEAEVFFSRDEALEFYKPTADQVGGKAELRNRIIHTDIVGDLVLVTEHNDFYILIENEWTFYAKGRLSTFFGKEAGVWKIVQQHGSMPDIRASEGEQFALEKISKENIELRDAVKRRTAELEYKNRELEIETCLERVRSRSLAMHYTSELQEVIHTVHKELLQLNIAISGGSFIAINDDIQAALRCWGSGGTADTSEEVILPLYDKPFCTNLIKGIKNGPGFFTEEFTQQEKLEFFTFLFTHEPWSNLDPKQKEETLSTPGGYTRSCCVNQHTSIFIINHFGKKFSKDENEILKRFAKVFEQAYTRFLDLQKAEAQGREANIETALEKVRSRTMGMQVSDDLKDVIGVIGHQLKALGLQFDYVNFVVGDTADGFDTWNVSGQTDPVRFFIPYLDNRLFHEMARSREERLEFNAYTMTHEETVGFIKHLITNGLLKYLSKEQLQKRLQSKGMSVSTAVLNEVYLTMANYAAIPYTDQENSILKRFGFAFQQAFTRFLDLQKAEAQARESQIQLALERVRARTMAMQKSEELEECAVLLFQQISELGINAWSAGFSIWKEDDTYFIGYNTNPTGGIGAPFRIPLTEDVFFKTIREAKRRGEEFLVFESEGQSLVDTYLYMDTLPVVGDVMRGIVSAGYALPKYQVTHCGFFSEGHLMFITLEPYPEAWDIFKRFTKVFEQTYTRFLDLQKAEAQAREAKIEAALEKARSRSMGMQSSDELPEVANVLFLEIQALGIPAWSCGYNILADDKQSATCWMSSEGTLQMPFRLRLYGETSFAEMGNFLCGEETMLVQELGDKALEEHYAYMKSFPDLKPTFDQIDELGLSLPTYQINHLCRFTQGFLLFITYEKVPDSHDIFKRFTRVFEQTYTRFLDLQKAEAQAREAKIEAALERVRSRSMGMQKSEELQDVIKIVYQQLSHLKIKCDHAGFVVDFTPGGDWHFWIADEQDIPAMITHPYFDSVWANQFNKAKATGANLFSTYLNFEEKNQFYNELLSHVPELPQASKDFYLSCPALAASTVLLEDVGLYIENFSGTPYTEEENNVLLRFGKVFQQTYTRFLDLQNAEAQAREATIEAVLERVRSRTMAMQKSDELTDVASLLFAQVSALGIKTWTAGFNVWSDDNNSYIDYITSPSGGFIEPYTVLTDRAEALQDISNARKSGVEFDVQYVEGEKIKQLYLALTGLDEKQYEIMLQDGVQFPSHQYEHFVFGSKVSLMFITYEPAPEAHDVFKRLGKVFEQTYTRFLDLQKAEAQARESQIQLGLERVRARAMAMQQSTELNALIGTVFAELTRLDLQLTRCIIMINDPETNASTWWMANSEAPDTPMNFYVPFHEHAPYLAYFQAWRERKLQWEYILEGPTKKDWDDFLFSKTGLSQLPGFVIDGMRAPEKVHLNASFNIFGNLTLSTLQPLTKEHADIVLRFAKVFDLTYTRFNDLKQAEAQAREAQIQLAMERVRARTMAMQHSDELLDVASVLFQQVKALGVPQWNCGFNIWEIGDTEFTYYPGTPDGIISQSPCKIPLTEHPVFKSFDESRRRGDELFVYEKEGDFQRGHYQYMLSLPGVGDLLQSMLNAGFEFPAFQIDHVANFAYGNLIFITYEHFPEMHDVFKRFAKVFEQTYIRFLDLQKAEAQAREAQIELGLERVRARAMAMQSSIELADLVDTVFKELTKLDFAITMCIINIIDEGSLSNMVWGANPDTGKPPDSYYMKFEDYPFHHAMMKGYKERNTKLIYVIEGEEKKIYDEYLFTQTEFRKMPLEAQTASRALKRYVASFTFSNFGGLQTVGDEALSDSKLDILARFGKVFDLTYTRFNDLQRAEAQSREATIEAALERVRGKALAMHNSSDLIATASLVFTELRRLGINPVRCGVSLQTKATRKNLLYYAIPSAEGDNLSLAGTALLEGHPVLSEVYETWLRGEDYFPVLKGESLISYYQILKEVGFYVLDSPAGHEQYGYYLPFSEGMFYGWAEKPFTESEIKILKRFAFVIDLTFRRYIELQKSEASAREAIKQAALDRIRADIASMRTVADLERITPLIWNELTALGVPFIRCGVFIMEENIQQVQTYLSTPDGKAIASFQVPFNTPGQISEIIAHWQGKKMYRQHWDEAAFNEFTNTLVKQGAITRGEKYLTENRPTNLHLHFLPFLQGMLYAGSETALTTEELQLVQNVADAFATAYARYEDFNKLESAKVQIERTLVDLKQAQSQLIQSEKMASLGELTAGIAHEIQNPLNFVNNFSELSNELIDEMNEELASGNAELASEIAGDIKKNLEKIHHHGRRAESIVTGMLQHSRASTGEKELIDINKLADEYLRLSYHGIRAKDNQFNCEIITDFDESIGKISIMGQDIGRVILNLINNAFYAVDDKKKTYQGELIEVPYKPTISVATKKTNNEVIITVSDNGKGIPEKIVDKIFQPFFTTKPTGEGTGLGLSLSYDIVKAHGGDLKVDTKEERGTAFIVTLPSGSV